MHAFNKVSSLFTLIVYNLHLSQYSVLWMKKWVHLLTTYELWLKNLKYKYSDKLFLISLFFLIDIYAKFLQLWLLIKGQLLIVEKT